MSSEVILLYGSTIVGIDDVQNVFRGGHVEAGDFSSLIRFNTV